MHVLTCAARAYASRPHYLARADPLSVVLPCSLSLSPAVRLDDSDCQTIGNLAAWGDLESLVKLDLSYNAIDGAGVEAITSGMTAGSLRSLKFLILDRNPIGDAGAVALADALSHGAMPVLTQLELGGSQVADAGCDALAGAITAGHTESLLGLVVGAKGCEHAALRAACDKHSITLV